MMVIQTAASISQGRINRNTPKVVASPLPPLNLRKSIPRPDIAPADLPHIFAGSQAGENVGKRHRAEQIADNDRNNSGDEVIDYHFFHTNPLEYRQQEVDLMKFYVNNLLCVMSV